jgi:cephalosporin hydroxylase
MAFQFLNRSARLPATGAEVAARFDAKGDDWWMTDAERLALVGLLADLRPECAIEVGVYRAGSLSVLSRFGKKVYALDIDPECEALFRGKFDNVEFITGDAAQTLPVLLARIQADQEPLGFVLIDADHRREGIRRDIEAVLRYTPAQPLYLLLHDSFNPECRRGIQEANWSANPHVHLVELDFVPGRFVTEEEPDGQREMWCGFALAVLLPEKRSGNVVVHENESLAFRSALRHSVHASYRWWNPMSLMRELKYRLKQSL